MKPVFFNTDNVRAALDSRKTVTRRVVKPQPTSKSHVIVAKNDDKAWFWWSGGTEKNKMKAPYRPGDILYVRETFFEYKGHFYYKADGKHEGLERMGIYFKWRRSSHMPREAARIFLRVTDVRVERLQDMTEDDVFAEGYEDNEPWCYRLVYENYPESPIPCYASSCKCPPDPPCNHSVPERFGKEIWNSTFKPADRALYGWEANPWVWVIEFEKISREEAAQHDKR